MKRVILFLGFILTVSIVSAQTAGTLDSTKKVFTAKASCGKCKFGLAGEDCELAVRINGKFYYVDSVSIDDLGDAHAVAGFCNAVRNARVQGEVVKGRFVATYFELLPPKKK